MYNTKKVNSPEPSKYFSPVERGKSVQYWQKELSYYYREEFICTSWAVNFLFLSTVLYHIPSDS